MRRKTRNLPRDANDGGNMTRGLSFPRPLLLSVHHAKSLCGVLSRLRAPREDAERASQTVALEPARKLARAWLSGRRQEVECFVEHVTTNVQSSLLGEVLAARAIDGYLTLLHEGLAVHFGVRFPSCCAASSSPVDRVRRRIIEGDGMSVAVPSWRRRIDRRTTRQRPDLVVDDLLAGLKTRSDGGG